MKKRLTLPNEAALQERIVDHLAARPRDAMAAAAWHGYVATLKEWGLIEPGTSALAGVLLRAGAEQAFEILLGTESIDTMPDLQAQIVELRAQAMAEAGRWAAEGASPHKAPPVVRIPQHSGMEQIVEKLLTLPNEAELRDRIADHLAARPHDAMTAAAWHGYVAALQEWGLIDAGRSDLPDVLPRAGAEQAIEILLGPEYIDSTPHMQAELQQLRLQAQTEAERWAKEGR